MKNAQTVAWLDQEDAHVTAMIRQFGLSIQYVFSSGLTGPDGGDAEGPPFGYTIGLFGLNHPELLIVGAPPDVAAGVLNALGDRVRAGETIMPGDLLTFEQWPHRIIPEPVPNPGEILLAANRFYLRPPRHSVVALQLSYDDPAGRFPWEAGYAAPHMQPRPGTFRA
jgi:hypothetical protein